MRATSKHRLPRPFVSALLSLTLVAAACGSADSGTAGAEFTPGEAEANAAETTTTVTSELDLTDANDDDEEPLAESGCESLEQEMFTTINDFSAPLQMPVAVDLEGRAIAFGPAENWVVLPSRTLLQREPLNDAGTLLAFDPQRQVFLACGPMPDRVVTSAQVARCAAVSGWNEVSVLWWGPRDGGTVEVVGGTHLAYAVGEVEASSVPNDLIWAVAERLQSLGIDPRQADDLGYGSGVFSDFGAPEGEEVSYQIVVRTADKETTIDCGEAGITAAPPTPTCVVSMSAGVPVFRASYDFYGPSITALLRDGEPVERTITRALDGGITDPSAEFDVTYGYDIEVDALRGFGPVRVPCGVATKTIAVLDGDSLVVARDLLASLETGPYVYMSMTVAGEPYEVSRLSGERFVFEPALPDGLRFDLTTIHDELAARPDDATIEIDALSGAPTYWAVDGVEWTISCIEYDTAPPHLRQGPCEFNNLIGGQ